MVMPALPGQFPPGLPMGGGAGAPPTPGIFPPPGPDLMMGPGPGMGMLPGSFPDPVMMGMTPGPPPAPMNPLEMLLSNPDLLAQLMGPQAMPRRRQKWQEPTIPKEGAMLTKARADQMRLIELCSRFDDNLKRISGASRGIFKQDEQDIRDGMASSFHNNAITVEHQLIASIVGAIPPSFESIRRRPADDDEAQAKTDFLAYCFEDWKRQHAHAGFGDLGMEMTKYILGYGRLASRSLCNFSAFPGESGFHFDVIDPATIYPTFSGRRGPVIVTRIFWQRLADVIGDHGDDEGKIERKIRGGRTDDGKDGQSFDYDEMVEVIEYHDCKWSAVFVAGRLVKGPVAHDYGEPPFVYTLAPYGPPASSRTPESAATLDVNGFSTMSLEADLAGRGLSHFANHFETHAQLEAIQSKLFSRMQTWLNEPIWYEKEQLAVAKRPNWSRAAGARNEIPEGYSLVPGPDSPIPPTLGPLLASLGEGLGRAGLPPSEYGLTPGGTQQSGYAIAGLGEHGQVKTRPVVLTMQQHLVAWGEQVLRFYHDNGHLMGDEGNRGVYAVPRTMPVAGQASDWEVTPDMIERTGTGVRVSLIPTPDAGQLGTLGNALGLFRQLGAVGRRDAIKLSGLPGSRNPEQTMREIDLERLKETPEYQLKELLKYVVETEDDPDAADFILSLIAKGQMKEAASVQGTANATRPPNPMGPQGGGPAQVPGLSLPGLGMPPGTQGGRPAQGPQQMPLMPSGPAMEP